MDSSFNTKTRPAGNLVFVTPNPVTGYTPAVGDAVGIEIATGKHQKHSAAYTAGSITDDVLTEGAPAEIFYGVIQKVETDMLTIQRGGQIRYSDIKHSVSSGAKETIFKNETLFINRFDIQ